ncbi:MAG: hypothetical protein M3O71_14855 [Bacteroidota bacterium]|nr:hypothetical protein [Bacteroidota bacterium]
MKLSITLFLLILRECVFGCTCGMLRDFKSKEDLNGYDFIALAKITDLPKLDPADRFMHTRVSADVNISILELFKGKPTTLIIDPDFKDDCHLNLQTGEQWILFGSTIDGKIIVSKCSYTTNYRDINGGRQWEYFGGIRQLDVLRLLYQHPQVSNMVEKLFYSNGNTELTQHFKNGKLNGVRKIYYPDGKLYITEEFAGGVRVGSRNFYGQSGQVRRSTIYENGLIKQVITYQDTTENAWYLNYQRYHNKDLLFGDRSHDTTFFIHVLDSLRKLKDWEKRIQILYKYSADGRSYKMEMYDYMGHPEADNYVDQQKQLSEYHRFYKNGKLASYQKYDQLHDLEIEYDYGEDGTRHDFVKTCESCKFYFEKDLPPAATPEKIYIQ